MFNFLLQLTFSCWHSSSFPRNCQLNWLDGCKLCKAVCL